MRERRKEMRTGTAGQSGWKWLQVWVWEDERSNVSGLLGAVIHVLVARAKNCATCERERVSRAGLAATHRPYSELRS